MRGIEGETIVRIDTEDAAGVVVVHDLQFEVRMFLAPQPQRVAAQSAVAPQQPLADWRDEHGLDRLSDIQGNEAVFRRRNRVRAMRIRTLQKDSARAFQDSNRQPFHG